MPPPSASDQNATIPAATTIPPPSTANLGLLFTCWTIGICFGIVVATWAFLAHRRGIRTILDPRRASMVALTAVAVVDLVYFAIKVPQLAGVGDCGILEAFSVLTYLGSHVAQYSFFIFRYVEVYGRRWAFLAPAIILVAIFLASIPVSIFSNRTVYTGAVCSVHHPPVSAYFPAAVDFVLTAFLITLFVEPLFRDSLMHGPAINNTPKWPQWRPRRRRRRQSDDWGGGDEADPVPAPPKRRWFTKTPSPVTPHARSRRRLAVALLACSVVGLLSTAFFHASLATPVGEMAPVVSSLDLAINFVTSALPYFMAGGGVAEARWKGGKGKAGGGGAQKARGVRVEVEGEEGWEDEEGGVGGRRAEGGDGDAGGKEEGDSPRRIDSGWAVSI
ncbi:hypothetical protein HDU96_007782 [Phlyctochytrium bullatum]|nr:hypothetical protein HDU96_007782 [Phlyctochytrium bullatum]